MRGRPDNVDEYLNQFPKEIAEKLTKIRNTIKKAAPKAEERISYSMPAYKGNRYLVYFAAFKSHIGFYPTASGIEAFKKELSTYKTSKGAVQFPLDSQIPYDLISRITRFRVQEDSEEKY